MRWFKKKKGDVRIGDVRIKEKFLFLPCRIGNEVRWLERAKIYQEVKEGYALGPYLSGPYLYWDNVKFIDD